MKELSSYCTHRPFYEQKMRLTSFFTHIRTVWHQIWYQFSLGMINVSCCSKNLGLFMSKEPNMRVFKKACPSGASLGWEVYPQYKHIIGFLAQTTIYICWNGVQGMQQHPHYPQKIPRIHPMRVLYEINYHPWSWNNPQFYHIWVSWGTNVIYSTRGYD